MLAPDCNSGIEGLQSTLFHSTVCTTTIESTILQTIVLQYINYNPTLPPQPCCLGRDGGHFQQELFEGAA